MRIVIAGAGGVGGLLGGLLARAAKVATPVHDVLYGVLLAQESAARATAPPRG